MMPKTNRDQDGGKRWPQNTKGKPVPGNYVVRTTDEKVNVVAEVVKLLDDGTLVLERKERANLFAPGTWKILLIDQANE
jgi:hypothetical protein